MPCVCVSPSNTPKLCWSTAPRARLFILQSKPRMFSVIALEASKTGLIARWQAGAQTLARLSLQDESSGDLWILAETGQATWFVLICLNRMEILRAIITQHSAIYYFGIHIMDHINKTSSFLLFSRKSGFFSSSEFCRGWMLLFDSFLDLLVSGLVYVKMLSTFEFNAVWFMDI